MRFVLAQTAGGKSLERLLATPGTSRTLLEAVVPYSAPSLTQWIGAKPDAFCSQRTARTMAAAAFHRAVVLSEESSEQDTWHNAVGIGCTASLASDRPKQGPHRIHVALQTLFRTWTLHIELTKQARSRQEENDLAGECILCAMAHAVGIEFPLPVLLPGEKPEIDFVDAPPQWSQLMAGELIAVRERGPRELPDARVRTVFSGSFNPLHPGHRRMLAIAERRTSHPVEFEISVFNVDKPPLDFMEITNRIGHFRPEDSLWLTRCATFVEKSSLFRDCCFVVGADTITRIADPRFYRTRNYSPQDAFRFLAKNGARFLVFGRISGQDFQTLDALNLPPELRGLCEGVDADEFREDVSSTELRQGKGVG